MRVWSLRSNNELVFSHEIKRQVKKIKIYNKIKHFIQYVNAKIIFLYTVLLNNLARCDCNIRSAILDKELDWTRTTSTADEIPKTYRSI